MLLTKAFWDLIVIVNNTATCIEKILTAIVSNVKKNKNIILFRPLKKNYKFKNYATILTKIILQILSNMPSNNIAKNHFSNIKQYVWQQC